MLTVNEKAPTDVKVLNMSEDEVTLKDYLDKDYLVVYFYPKDNTPGCTKEACSFRDFNKDIEQLGARVIGVSKDPVKSHHKFTQKFELNFELLSDESLELHKAFGVWVEKSMYGKKYMGAQRSTFVLDKNGKVIHVWENVKPNVHAEEVYNFLKDK